MSNIKLVHSASTDSEKRNRNTIHSPTSSNQPSKYKSTLKVDSSKVDELEGKEKTVYVPYEGLGLRPDVVDVLRNKLGWTYPTSVQAVVYPLANIKKNVVASSWTGQGKTGSYMVPIINQILELPPTDETSPRRLESLDRKDIRYVRPKAIVLAPSSELARQVAEQFINFGKHFKIKTGLIINDKTIDEQLCDLSSKTDIIVSTPGRLSQHLQYAKSQAEKDFPEFPKSNNQDPDSKAVLCTTRLRHFVVDECDKLLSLGFLPEVLNVWRLASQPLDQERSKKIQVMVCSATLVQEVHGFIMKLAPHHRLVDLNANMSVPKTVTQIQYDVTSQRKLALLLYLIGRKGNVSLKKKKTLIFVRTIQRCDRLVERLTEKGLKAAALHSDVAPSKRLKALRDLKSGHVDYIVATDIATRGIDLPILDYVVNFDLPHIPADYVHRVGRVGRAGREGVAVTLVAKDPQLIRRHNACDTTLDEQQLMRDISALLAQSATDKHASKLEKRKIPGPFLDVTSFHQIKSIVGDPRYSDLVEHALLEPRSLRKDTPLRFKNATGKPAQTSSKPSRVDLPSENYSDLMSSFAKNSAKKQGIVVSKKDATARLRGRKLSPY
ncbi:hypothetical protein DSO57_1004482 [Entomophthora muscae]|uniref:Uncharacterized protein n=1 Tax=Entomophthora muscae TaxID=34485 RepID=A0ACC2UV38_9FUNG|nr:hypothetical protein DSO57_1004482 [Entomophthora muscae]